MADWPLTSDLGPLGALPTAPRLARGFIGVVLNGWGLDALIETTELVVSELTTNVVQAVTGADGSLRYDAEGKLPLLWVRLSSDRLRLMVEVWDTLPAALGAPAMRHPHVGFFPLMPYNHRWLALVALAILLLTFLPAPFVGTSVIDLFR